jgi:hypothetical protein
MIRAAAGWSDAKMPLARYFFFVGGVLLALLFVIDAYAPPLPVADRTEAAADFPVIRINSERKWPKPVVFDTNMPAIVPTQLATAGADVPPPTTIAAVSAGARVRGAFAQFTPADPKKPEPRLLPKHKIAKSRPKTILAAQQPRFGFLANN